MAILAAVVSDTAPPLSSVFPGVPKDLDEVVRRCLEKDATRRFPSVAALALALEPFAGPESRPLVGRIEGIERAGRSIASSPTELSTPSEFTSPKTVPATLESARDSPYGLESRTAPQPHPSSLTQTGRSRAARVGVLAIVAAFGGLMYLVGALRPWDASDKASAGAGLATSPTRAAIPLAASAALLAAASPPAAASSPEITLVPPGAHSASLGSPAAEASVRRLTTNTRSAKTAAPPVPSALPSSGPPPAPTPSSDPFDQRR